ncbi:MAG: hypothetical protein JSR54_05085 [Proteobacteria bacterium]|nr:hypothetical protein [Pseudomonadota bacterium]
MHAVTAGSAAAPARPGRFHLWMAVAFAVIAFAGFTPSYWRPIVFGAHHVPPMYHIHGALLFSWTLFYLAQAAWVANGRTATHRAWGLAGISLFTLVACSIVLIKITGLRLAEADGFGDAGRRFAAVPLLGLAVMVALFAGAIANVQRPQVHKRLMLVVMAATTIPAIARVFIALLAPPGAGGAPPPPAVGVGPSLVAALLVGIALVHERRATGRWQPIYAYGALAILAQSGLAVLVAPTPAWLAFAGWLQHLPD